MTAVEGLAWIALVLLIGSVVIIAIQVVVITHSNRRQLVGAEEALGNLIRLEAMAVTLVDRSGIEELVPRFPTGAFSFLVLLHHQRSRYAYADHVETERHDVVLLDLYRQAGTLMATPLSVIEQIGKRESWSYELGERFVTDQPTRARSLRPDLTDDLLSLLEYLHEKEVSPS